MPERSLVAIPQLQSDYSSNLEHPVYTTITNPDRVRVIDYSHCIYVSHSRARNARAPNNNEKCCRFTLHSWNRIRRLWKIKRTEFQYRNQRQLVEKKREICARPGLIEFEFQHFHPLQIKMKLFCLFRSGSHCETLTVRLSQIIGTSSNRIISVYHVLRGEIKIEE